MRHKVQILIFVLLLTSASSAQVPPAITAATELGKYLISTDLITEIFKWWAANHTSKDIARLRVKALYEDLLVLQTSRNALTKDLQQRLKEIDRHRPCEITCDYIWSDANQLGSALDKFGKDYKALAVALDVAAPDITRYQTLYTGPNGEVVGAVRRNPSELSKKDVRDAYTKLVNNEANFSKVLKLYRDFVKKSYPDYLELAT